MSCMWGQQSPLHSFAERHDFIVLYHSAANGAAQRVAHCLEALDCICVYVHDHSSPTRPCVIVQMTLSDSQGSFKCRQGLVQLLLWT